MINVKSTVKLPFLWGKEVFKKENWSQINLIVGPNGSGKSLLAESLVPFFKKAGYTVAYLQANREVSNLKNNSWIKNDDIRNKIANVLSGMIGKEISFEKGYKGRYVPFVVNEEQKLEYNLHKGKIHGLKEIINLLATLYDDKNTCLFLDEPELHLYPQLQQFFMNEIRKVAKQNPKKIFFIITHSPFFIDLRFPEELIGVVVTHVNKTPTHIENLSDEDEQLFKRFLPRFNTYHKQFFFSDNQVFVEGYTDQQMFTNLLNGIKNPMAVVRTGIIDVGGKDELGVFCKVCSLLGTDGRIITDLDSLFGGKVRDIICQDTRISHWLDSVYQQEFQFYLSIFSTKEFNRMIDTVCLSDLIEKLQQLIATIGKYVCKIDYSVSKTFDIFVEKLQKLYDKYENADTLDVTQAVLVQGILKEYDMLQNILPLPLARTLPLIKHLYFLILEAAEKARVYILSKGCIEHYYTQNHVQFMPVSGKDKLFHAELEHLSHLKINKLRTEYAELIDILERALY